MQEFRKIQKTGGSTFIVSLPKEWVKSRLKKGDKVSIISEGDSLIISQNIEEKDVFKKVRIKHEGDLNSTFRSIVSYYLVGYDTIDIYSEDFLKEKDDIKDLTTKKIIGMDVINESSNSITIQNFLKWDSLPLKDTLSRIHLVTASMYNDFLMGLEKKNRDIIQDVIKRENDVDKFYLLGVRQLKAGIYNKFFAEKLKVTPGHCLEYRLAIKCIERIGDHIEKMANNLLLIKNLESFDDLIEELVSLGRDSYEIYRNSVKSLLRESKELADQALRDSSKVLEIEEKIKRNILKLSITDAIYFSIVLDSIMRILSYSNDIAEVTLNLVCEKKH
jgi:phosphate uptake regulator